MIREVLTTADVGTTELVVMDVDGDLGAHAAHRAEWSELVPVVLIDGGVHAVIRVDAARLRVALDRSTVRESIHKG